MNFTEGKGLEYERLMKQKPGFHKKRDKTSRERDCHHCLYWNEALQQCLREKCIVFYK
ncbi:MAG: hypothetical protein RR232_02165 [Clostridia bacterium]